MPPETQAGAFWQDAPAYHGTIAEAYPFRLIVSPNGSRYCLQERGADGRYQVRRWRKSLALLLPDLPEGITAQGAVSGLPDDPRQFPRHWAAAMDAQRLRLRRACPKSQDYSGVLVPGSPYRLAMLVSPRRYALQERQPSGVWRCLRSSASASTLRERLRVMRSGGDLSRLSEGLAGFPENAADYLGPMPETYAEARRKRPALGREAAQGSQGAKRPDSARNRPQRRVDARRGSDPRKAATAPQQAHKRAQGEV